MTHELDHREENGHGVTIVCTCGEQVHGITPAKADTKFAAHIGIKTARSALRRQSCPG